MDLQPTCISYRLWDLIVARQTASNVLWGGRQHQMQAFMKSLPPADIHAALQAHSR